MTLDIQFIEINQALGSFIQENVDDPDSSKDRVRWVYPTFTKTESKLPQVTVSVDDNARIGNSAGERLQEELREDGTFIEYFYRLATYSWSAYVITSKETPIEFKRNGETYYLKGKKANTVVTQTVAKALMRGRDQLLQLQGVQDFKVLNISPVYNDAEYSWGTEISGEFVGKDVWAKEYLAGKLVNSFDVITVVP